jgi:hypothetical protein
MASYNYTFCDIETGFHLNKTNQKELLRETESFKIDINIDIESNEKIHSYISYSETDNQITQHASQEIANANYNRQPSKKGVPPYL